MKASLLKSVLPIAAAAALCLPATLQAAAPEWSVNGSESRLTFSGTNAGNAFEGHFDRWDSRIRFDPDDLAGSRIIIVVATGTATLGDRVQETTLRGGEWFDTGNHPTATFSSNSIEASGGNRYIANGTLSMKGRTVPISLPFTVTINGTRAQASGQLTLDRTQLGLGMQSDPRAEWVSRNIDLRFSLTATRS